ncbi:39S ribosomal protein L24: mitochondrial-like protein [Dinothrombium tinctorium]|uniref:Large ribosomal subunit protein uL24m n=1 Tax=Dinothrombium tinctorium TaxID=1965070 RepID=A0A3S3RX83_9ACAR|nr:39S ribosomal protein L24: mitochondrial-like protein [Dinothrombium tinctorium]
MRFSLIRQCYSKLPKDFSNFPQKYIKKQTEFIEYQTPRLPFYLKKTVRWRNQPYYDIHRPWSKEFQEQNAPGVKQPSLFVEPIKYFYIFRGDRVEILRGKDKGKQGVVNYVVLERNWVFVEQLNLKYRVEDKSHENPGHVVVEEMPLLIPRDVALIDPSDMKPTTIEWMFDDDGKQVRVSVRTGRIIPIPLQAFETYDYKTKETYKEQSKDTKAKDVTEITFEPKVKTFEMDLMDEYGIKEDRIPRELFSDIVFETNDGEILAHRTIVASSSLYFEQMMFANGTKKRFMLPTSTRLANVIMRYIYTGDENICDLTDEEKADLFSLSCLCELHEFADLILIKIDETVITFENVNKFYEMAFEFDVFFIAEKCLNFIDLNACDVIEKRHIFSKFGRKLLESILSRDTFEVPEIEIFRAVKCWIDANPNEKSESILQLLRLNLISNEDYVNIIQPTQLITESQFIEAFKKEKICRSRKRKDDVFKSIDSSASSAYRESIVKMICDAQIQCYLEEEMASVNISTQYDFCFEMLAEISRFEDLFYGPTIFAKTLLHNKEKKQMPVPNISGLFHYFQQEFDADNNIGSKVASIYTQEIDRITVNNFEFTEKMLNLGLALSTFFLEGYWFVESESVLLSCLSLYSEDYMDPLVFEIHIKLLETYNYLLNFEKSDSLIKKMQRFINDSKLEENNDYNILFAYLAFSQYYYLRYAKSKDAGVWCDKALNLLTFESPSFSVIETLRQYAKVCIAKRDFSQAKTAMEHLLEKVKSVFKVNKSDWSIDESYLHPKVVEVLYDYAYYLSRLGLIDQSVFFYQKTLQICKKLYEEENATEDANNLLLAFIRVDLGWDSYRKALISDLELESAKEHIDAALRICKRFFAEDHPHIIRIKRMKAAVVAEIAHIVKDFRREQLFRECEETLLDILNVYTTKFGDTCNNGTARSYHELGRLYRKMQRFEEAEQMYTKALKMKGKLYGPNSEGVAITFNNLATLYKCNMSQYEKAEEMYLKSVSINQSLFGEYCNQLMYDYCGLISLYSKLNNEEKVREYTQKLEQLKLELKEDSLQ